MRFFEQLIDDAAMFPPGDADAESAVMAHLRYRQSWFAWLVGPLVVPDTKLAEVARVAAAHSPAADIGVSVVNTSGAGGLTSLADRRLPGVRVVSVESALRDLDDLTGNAARTVSAARALDSGVSVFVEFPYVPGWERAVEVVAEAGLTGKIRTGGVEPFLYPDADQLAAQLSVLVEADLAFKATAGLHRAWPNTAHNARSEALAQHGFITLILALGALIDGAAVNDAAQLLRLTDRAEMARRVDSLDEAARARIRRRFHSFGCCGVTDPIDDLVHLGLVQEA